MQHTLSGLNGRLCMAETSGPEIFGLPEFVTLDQAAAIVGRSKRCLQKYLYEPGKVQRYRMPGPAIDGGGGRANEWDWSVLRPWLEQVFHRKLPEHFPNFPLRR